MKRAMLSAEQKSAAVEYLKRTPSVMKRMTYREREVVKLRYGLCEGGYTYTLEEVGHIFKVTRERIRSIENAALSKLHRAAYGTPPWHSTPPKNF